MGTQNGADRRALELGSGLAAAEALGERYRLALDAAEIGTFDLDLGSGELSWDERCRELFGLPPDAPVSYEGAFLPGLHPDDRSRVHDAVQALLSGGGDTTFDVEYRTIGAADGTERWVVAKGRLIHSGGQPVRFVGAVRDVTRRRLGEIRLKDAEERYRLALRATADVVWDWDLARDEVLWNDALSKAWGYDLAEVEPTGAWWIDHIHPGDRDRVSADIHAVIDGAGERWIGEYRFRRADGSYAFVHDRGFVIRDGTGRAVRMIGAMLDFSERKRAEEQQGMLLGELQHRVKNTLAMVQAIASQTFRGSTTPEARETFTARVIALSHANDVLTSAGWAAAPLDDVVRGATIPHCAGPERFSISGPAIQIAARAALSLTLALHELCTNAAKYGALSNDQGHIEIHWNVGGDEVFRLRWAERGGPPVQKPLHSGFGTRLIDQSLGPGLGGKVDTDFDPEGLVCTFQIPLATVQVPAEFP